FPHEGAIDFVDNQVNPKTGTMRLRGVFPNKDQVLAPGFFARVRAPIGRAHKALLVNERALDTDQGQKILYVVNEKNEVVSRPVLAWVISIVIILLGGIAAGLLPIAQYPQVTPPTVRVTAIYPGANAQVVADTIAAPIEQQVNGVENMLYMSSQSSNDGSYTLDVTFALGTDVNMAQVLVQNRVAIGEPTLPDVVRAVGV